MNPFPRKPREWYNFPMHDKKTVRFVAEHRDTLSKNQIAKTLGVEKQEIADILKKIDSGRLQVPSRPTRLSGVFEQTKKRFFSSRFLPPLSLFGLALLLRGSFLFSVRNDPLVSIPILDAAYYLRWAETIVHGGTFFPDAYFVEPGYAFLLAAVISLFGSTFPVLVLQTVLGGISAALLYLASVRATGRIGWSFLGGIFVACCGPLIFHDALLLKTSVEFFLLSVVSYLAITAWENQKKTSFFVLGTAIGLTAVFKANVLYALPLLAGTIFFALPEADRRARIRLTAIFLIGAVILISPVTIRNWQKSHAFVPINASGGPNLYIGNWEGADGTLKPPEFVSVNPEHEEESWKAITESYTHRVSTLPEVSSFWSGRAIGEILSFPERFFELSSKKLLLIFHSSEFGDNADRAYAFPLFPPLTFLPSMFIGAIFGLVGALLFLFDRRRYRTLLPLLAIGVGYAATLVAGHVAERYRLALLPFFLPFAIFTLGFLADAWRKRSFERLFSASLLILFLVVLAFLPVTASGTGIADMYANFARAERSAGNIGAARSHYESGLRADPDHIPSKTGLAEMELITGNADRAITLYREALLVQWELPTRNLGIALDIKDGKISPEEARAKLISPDTTENESQYDADFIEGMKYFRKRDFESALPFFERAHTKHPENESILANLATTYKNTKQAGLAEKIFLEILVDHPENLPVRFNLANLYLGKKELFPAIRELEEINRIAPGFYTSRFDLAKAYLKNGNRTKAAEHLRLFIDESSGIPGRKPLITEAEKVLDSIGNTR